MNNNNDDPSLPIALVDATEEGYETFKDNCCDAEIGTAIPLQGSILNDPTASNEAKSHKLNWKYVFSVCIVVLIVWLSIEIAAKTNRRSASSKAEVHITVTDNPTQHPSSTPSITSVPTSAPSLSRNPSRSPSNLPSSSSSPTTQPSESPSMSTPPSSQPTTGPTSYPSNSPSFSSYPTTQPSETPSMSASPSAQPTISPTTELENYVPNVSTLRNQIICGYQGWFAFPGDGAAINKWKHWFSTTNDPSAEHLKVDMYPYVDEYNDEDLKESNIQHRDGTKAKFFSSARPNVVKKHFEWMREYGISGVFHMRFMQDIDKPHNREWKTKVLRNVRAAAEQTGRVFAVSYNIAGNDLNNTVLDAIRSDWMDLVDKEEITQSGRYLRHNGLPVLRIFGIGFKSVTVSDTVKMAKLIDWFQSEAESKYRVFLIGGVPSQWRDLTGDSREAVAWRGIYESLDGIHPWHVGRWSSIFEFEAYYEDMIAKDAELCSELGILYMPTMWPGFSWHNLNRKQRYENGTLQAIPQAPINAIPRLGGRFMWSQAFRYAENDNITSVWMAQFDEVDEGTAIFKVAKTEDELPAQGTWLTLDIDGEDDIPRDWYLRLCGHAQRMMSGEIELTETMPINASDYCLECQGTSVVDQ